MTVERTRYETCAEIDYACRLFERHELLYARFAKWIKLATTLLTLAPVASLLEKLPKEIGIGAAILAAALSLWDVIYDPTSHGFRYEQRRRVYQRLKASASDFDDADLVRQLEVTRIDDPPTLSSLREPAYNDVLNSLGHTPHQKLSLLERAFCWAS